MREHDLLAVPLRPATTAKPLLFSVAATSCHPGRATLRLLEWTAPRHRVPELELQTTNTGAARDAI